MSISSQVAPRQMAHSWLASHLRVNADEETLMTGRLQGGILILDDEDSSSRPSSAGHVRHRPRRANAGRYIGKAKMSTYRLFSMLYYGAAAVLGTTAMLLPSVPALFAVVGPVAAAAAADRFINRNAEPDDRMRSFTMYALGALAGLLAILFFGGRLGVLTFAVPVVAFGVFALIDFLMPPAGYQPRDPHRYGESPPVTQR
jgi:hypothetical protein